MIEYIFAKKLNTFYFTDNPENLLKKQSLQIGLAESITANVAEGGYIILDFGKEMNGGIRILTYLARQARVRIRFGESLTECCAELGGEKNATNDHSIRDFEVNLPDYSDMIFGNTGFRFVRLDFYNQATIKSIVAVNHIFKKKAIYRYEGKDECIRQIYETAKRTLDLCTANAYVWDGVKRDRLVWIGDIHPEMLALTTLYGRVPILEKSLDFVKAQTPLPGWMNGYPMYSMWWIIIVADYYERTKTRSFLQKQVGYLEGLVEQINHCVKADGTLEYPGYFVDWPTVGQPDEKQGVRAINILAMKKAIFIFQLLGRDITKAQDILNRLLQQEIIVQKSKQVAGLKYLAVGLSDEDKTLLVDGGAKGMSTFMSYYILKAIASFNKETAIEVMKEYYGAMLDKGATHFGKILI